MTDLIMVFFSVTPPPLPPLPVSESVCGGNVA